MNRRGFLIDGQKQPTPPATRIELLDSAGFDLRMTPQPMVRELAQFDEFIAAGGWVPTVPAELEP